MCILSRKVRSIEGTSIFCADLGRGEHTTVYSMRLDAPTDVAMILPVPALRSGGDTSLRFVTLEECPDFFKRLERLFPDPDVTKGDRGPLLKIQNTLQVHDVGSFWASYVPTREDFGRLYPIFRLADSVWESLPDYGSFGFAVFQFKESTGPKLIHPMAYRYDAENPDEMFYPTVHVHDGQTVSPRARFDHRIYIQESENFRQPEGWARGVRPPGRFEEGRGLVDADRPVYLKRIAGYLPNADTVLAQDGPSVRIRYRGPYA